MDSNLSTSHRSMTFFLYTAMILVGVAAFMLIRSQGESITPRMAVATVGAHAVPAHDTVDTLLHVLLALAAVIVTARAMGILFQWMHQPPVIGEVIGGIVLGPSLLGRIAPEITAYILPPTVAPFLGVIAQLGVILYMFVVGLELDLKVAAKSGHATLAISHASILVPFLLGALLSLGLYAPMGTQGVSFTVFALFMGVSMSVTAFPVLARILTDRKMNKTKLGNIALTCAAVDDVTAWCLLAFVVSIAHANLSDAVWTLGLTVLFVLFVLTCIAPMIRRLIPRLERSAELTRTGMAIIFVAMLLSAMATEFIGIHAIIGAFLLGAVIPHDSRVASELTHRLDDVIAVLFLPTFFAFTGMRTQIGLISGWENWLLCGIIILVACVGKFGGTLVVSRLSGLSWRDASALGILMNTRGLVELIVLNIGLDLGVISPTLFAMLVIMALVTTFMTSPILHALLKGRALGEALGAPSETATRHAGT